MATKIGINIGDGHCGHKFGLTPPEYFIEDKNKEDHLIRKFQEFSWDFFVEELKKIGHIDVCNYNGDMIEGRGEKTGGRELSTPNRIRQVDIACTIDGYVSKYCSPKNKYVVIGTAYHVGAFEDWEQIFGRNIKAEETAYHIFFDMNGIIFDCKHHIGTSQVPHGRSTAINREALWAQLWHEQHNWPNSNVMLRNHGHYYEYSGRDGKVGIICPGLEGATIFGSSRCSGTIDYGLLEFKVTDNKEVVWKPHLMDLQILSPEIHLT